MPLYEYKCQKCQKITEELFSINSFPREIKCECGDIAHKIISHTSFTLNGGGWAKDGYTTNMEKFKANMKAVDTY